MGRIMRLGATLTSEKIRIGASCCRSRRSRGAARRRPGRDPQHRRCTDLTTVELTKLLPVATGRGADATTYVPDRPANDIRHSLNWDKTAALGFAPSRKLADGLADTVAWYRRHPERLATTTTPADTAEAELNKVSA